MIADPINRRVVPSPKDRIRQRIHLKLTPMMRLRAFVTGHVFCEIYIDCQHKPGKTVGTGGLYVSSIWNWLKGNPYPPGANE